jgi:NAD(P)-dependent dehydrogenase (short-subunit alcohol dehydrogenase family)
MTRLGKRLKKLKGAVKTPVLRRKRFVLALRTLVTWYLAIVGAYWVIFEPITHFKEEFLKAKLGGYWWIVIYVLPVPVACVAAFHRYKHYHWQILDEFDYKTAKVIDSAQLTITSTGKSFERREVQTVESQLELDRAVLITGDSGTGKSGIGVAVTRRAQANKQRVLLIDARQVQHLEDEYSLRQFYKCEKPLSQEIAALSPDFRLVIDQLDNVVGKRISDVLISLAIECSKFEGIQVVVISRNREAHEAKLLDKLQQEDFVEIKCRELDEREVEKELQRLGFAHVGEKLVSMCKNLLNLEILSTIKTEDPSFNPTDVEDEVALWEKYLDTLQNRESDRAGFDAAEQTINEAMKLAVESLTSDRQLVELENAKLVGIHVENI